METILINILSTLQSLEYEAKDIQICCNSKEASYAHGLSEAVKFVSNMIPKLYFRVIDTQCGTYFGTGYNATSIQELVDDFKCYIENGNDAPESMDIFNTWYDIDDWLQGAEIEISQEPFEKL